MNVWRVGSKVPLNVYEGDRPVCQCHSAEDAARIVATMNALESSVRLQSHYALLLNQWDGGKRMVFESAAAWLARLEFMKEQERIRTAREAVNVIRSWIQPLDAARKAGLPMRVKLTTLSVCDCGFPLLKDEIRLGQEYTIWPETEMLGYRVKCGGCGKMNGPFVTVNASCHSNPSQEAKPLPLLIFDVPRKEPDKT